MERRKFISSLAVGGTVAIAGCSGIGGRTPEETVQVYYDAAKEGDIETLNEVIHPKSTYYPINQNNVDSFSPSGTLVSTSQMSDSDVEGDLEEYKQRIKSEANVEEVTFVSTTIERNGEQQEQPIPLAKHEGEWKFIF